MFYHIERTLEFLPGVACTILVLVFLFLEVKNVKEQLRDKPVPEPGRGSFIPPEGEGALVNIFWTQNYKNYSVTA